MSVPFRAADAARWMGGRLVQGDADARFTGVSIDTRTLASGVLFIAIRGENHDAHAFLADAVTRGAAGLVTEHGRGLPAALPPTLPVIAVDDSTRGLAALGAHHRAGFDGPVVAITGSNGKTTTKELCAAILQSVAPCLKTPGNWNNGFGVPLTLLLRQPEDRALVIEMGMNHRGEIAPLVAIARPTVGLITNVGTAHIENLGTQEAIALEKGDLVAGLDASATAVLNADDPHVLAQSARTTARVVTFARRERADVVAEHVRARGAAGFDFDLVAPEGRIAVHVPGLGETLVINALAAAAASLAAGARLHDVASGLSHWRPVGGRMEPIQLPRNIVLINDTYNANPQSMAVALRSLAELKGGSRGLAVLGDMAELGERAGPAHREAGRLVAELAIEVLIAVGQHASETAAGARAAGMDAARIHVESDAAAAGAGVRHMLQGNDWVLVKGSRSARMERVVEALSAAGVEH